MLTEAIFSKKGIEGGLAALYPYSKRAMDFLCSLLGLILLSPLFLLIATVIKLDSEGKVLFAQERFGVHKKTFRLWKFRTMQMDAPHDLASHLLPEQDKWVTRAGRFLRKTSLDELPQLFNILKGEMSFVGPRPALWNQDDLISERNRYGANEIPVGLTGWAQVKGRDLLSIEEKAKLDGEYAAEMSFLFDLRCLLLTIPTVFGWRPKLND